MLNVPQRVKHVLSLSKPERSYQLRSVQTILGSLYFLALAERPFIAYKYR